MSKFTIEIQDLHDREFSNLNDKTMRSIVGGSMSVNRSGIAVCGGSIAPPPRTIFNPSSDPNIPALFHRWTVSVEP
jgi:hypothetical protein